MEKKIVKTTKIKSSSVKKASVEKQELGKYIEGIGRRKTSVARVRIFKSSKGSGITINGKKVENYFPLKRHQNIIFSPLIKTDLNGKFFVSIKVKGGGVSSQADAIRLGLSRAIVKDTPGLRKKLKVFGYLTRDARIVERKKYGLKKARKAPQWSKR